VVVLISNNKFTDSMLEQLFTKYVVIPLVILSINCGDCMENSCLGRGVYLGIERAGTGGRGRKEGWGRGRGLRHGVSKVLSP
jgi:hypothetical protein